MHGEDTNDESSSEQAQAGANTSPDEDQSAEQTGDEPQKSEENQGAKSLQEQEADSGQPKDPKQEKRDKELSNSVKESIIYWHGEDKIPETLDQTKEVLTEVMGLGASFDVVFREMFLGGRKTGLLLISGFAKDIVLDEILKRLTYLTPNDMSSDAIAAFMYEYIPHIQVEKAEELSVAINQALAGMSVLFIEGESRVIIMDTRIYPVRGPEEPSIERVVRGARDGFTETLMSNIALVRRRLRDPGLKFELHKVGRRTQTDVSIAYIDDIVDKTQVKAVVDKMKTINIDGIPLADKQLEEAIVGKNWNPYPMVRYSERPDVVASHLLEGRVVLFVDTSPSVMIIPTTFFDLCQHAEENRQTPLMGSYLRWVRFAGIFASIFLLPLWMLLVIHPELKPPMFEFIGPQKNAKLPLLVQFLIIEFGVDLLRMAAVHTPTPLGSAMGLIAAILIGDIAVKTGLFVNEVVLYMAVAAIGMFATPSYELGLANRLVRLLLLLATGFFGVAGFVIATTLFIILLTVNRSYNSSYLWPFIPFNAKAMGAILFRVPVLSAKTRPSFDKTRDNTRMPLAAGKKDKS
ncbi:spore germination protein [Paenibacillus zanthoxyli]|uniref:spore germination protein n=1 Tax=Paenibacillus zanthoxyli TaxID=369399 RepID=UPI00055EDA52